MPTMSSIACSSLRPCWRAIVRHVWKSRASPIAPSNGCGGPSGDSQPLARVPSCVPNARRWGSLSRHPSRARPGCPWCGASIGRAVWWPTALPWGGSRRGARPRPPSSASGGRRSPPIGPDPAGQEKTKRRRSPCSAKQKKPQAGFLRWDRARAKRCGGTGCWPPSRPTASSPMGAAPW